MSVFTRSATALIALAAFVLSLTAIPVTANPVSSPSAAGNAVEGTVTFPDGSPAAGAFVSIRAGEGRSDTADANGDYSISGIDDGFVIVDASINVDGVIFTGSAFVGFAPGGGSTVTADIVVRSFTGPFPPAPF